MSEPAEPEPIHREPVFDEESRRTIVVCGGRRKRGRARAEGGCDGTAGAQTSWPPRIEGLGAEEEEAKTNPENRQEIRNDRGRGRGSPPAGPEEPRRPEFPEEDILEPEEAEIIEPMVEEDDDEEIDKLTDWNVPSWNELIGSLYRPER